MQRLIEKAAILMEALPYIQDFRDSIIVVKFGGSAMEDPERKAGILKDIVFMECAGMRPVVVHGGGKAISAKLAAEKVETKFIQGLRYTCDQTISIVDDVLHNTVNAELIRIMDEFNGKPRAMSGKDVLRAEPVAEKCLETGEVLDLGHVGRVTDVDIDAIHQVLDRREVPVITPLGCDESGRVFNINADMAACRIAAKLKAKKLAFLSDVPGILESSDNEESLISTIRLDEIDSLIQRGVIHGGMVPKVRSAADALNEGVGKVHMIDGRVKHSLLLEIFTDQGIGTQIVH
jgi:acetylglutamate kinase